MIALSNTTNSRRIRLRTHSSLQPKHQRKQRIRKSKVTTKLRKKSHKARMLQDPRSRGKESLKLDIKVLIPQMMILLTNTSHQSLKL